MISRQRYSGKGLVKMEQGIKVPIESSSQYTREGVGFTPPSLPILSPKSNPLIPQETRPSHMNLSKRIFWRLKHDKKLLFLS